MAEEVTAAAVEEDITTVVDLPHLLEVGMGVEVIRIVHLHAILLLGTESILLRPNEMTHIRRVAEMNMLHRGNRVPDMMMIVRGGDLLQTLQREERTMGGVIGELSFFCAGFP